MSYTRTNWVNSETALSAANMNNIEDGIEEALAMGSSLALMLHPVGEFYWTSSSSFNPNTAWGGTWEKLTDGRVLIAAGGSHAAGSTGGAETVTLTAAQSGVPAHSHGFTQPTLPDHVHTSSNSYIGAIKDAASGSARFSVHAYNSDGITEYTAKAKSNTGNPTTNPSCSGGAVQDNTAANASQAHNNMQPWRAAYCWHRTA